MDFSNIPILSDIDFSDPAKRKSSIRICVAGVMLVMALIAVVIKSATSNQNEQQQLGLQYESPEVPLGEDADNLHGKTIRDVSSSRRGRAGATANDLFSDNIATQDPLSALKGNVQGDDDPTSSQGNVPSFVKDAAKGNAHINNNNDNSTERKESSPSQKSKVGSNSPTQSQQTKNKAEQLSEELMSGDHPGVENKRRRLYEAYGMDPETGQLVNPPSFTSESAGSNASSSSAPQQAKTETAQDDTDQQPIEQARVQVRKSGGVSAFGLNDNGLGSSLSSLGDANEFVNEDPSHPFKVKFAYDEKVSSGQRVTIRLCEDMVVDGVLIPTNTHLFATCQVGERLKLSVSSIDINGKIYTLNYTAYDNDGAEGLYCPQSEASKVAKQIGENAGEIAQQAVQTALTGYPARIFQSGASIFKQKNGSVTISVTAGYTFYLIQDKR